MTLKQAIEICKKSAASVLFLGLLDIGRSAADLEVQATLPLAHSNNSPLLPSALRVDGTQAQHSYIAYWPDLAKSVHQNQAGKK